MKQLITKEERRVKLLALGAPKKFVDNIGLVAELKYRVEDVEGAYFYLPRIANYNILSNQNVVPVFDEGETFCVVIYDDIKAKIIRFELENDSIYDDYDLNWDHLLFDIMFQYFEDEADGDLDLERFKEVADKIGFDYAEPLFNALNIPVEEYNKRYEELENWKTEIRKAL